MRVATLELAERYFRLNSFSSLFVGMRVATWASAATVADRNAIFQFPFRRDARCNLHHRCLKLCRCSSFQFPFRRDARCNKTYTAALTGCGTTFSSLFVGMRVATGISVGRGAS